MSENRWEVIQEESPSTVVFDTIGDTVIGRYLGSEEIDIQDEEGNSFTRYLIRQEGTGELLALNASYRLTQAFSKIDPGSDVMVEYVKNIPTGQPSPMKDFRVSVAR